MYILFFQAMSTSVLRSQTTANLAALASISKAPSTSSLITAAKKVPASGTIHGSGGSKKLTPKIGSASSHLNKFSSRIFSPSKSSASKTNFGSAQKAGPSNLVSLTSFLPSKSKAPKPTQGNVNTVWKLRKFIPTLFRQKFRET